jgi:hypothetical protein
MAHPVQQKWCNDMKRKFPEYFKNKKVLDIGSLDINGNNRYLFEDCIYHGLDLIEGKNVDIVSIAHEYKPDFEYDTIISTNALEHDMYYELTIKSMYNLLKPNGLMFFSVANGWKEHGTLKTSPSQSATSKMNESWSNYYKNLEIKDVTPIIEQMSWKEYSIKIENKDLQFWGIKNEY